MRCLGRSIRSVFLRLIEVEVEAVAEFVARSGFLGVVKGVFDERLLGEVGIDGLKKSGKPFLQGGGRIDPIEIAEELGGLKNKLVIVAWRNEPAGLPVDEVGSIAEVLRHDVMRADINVVGAKLVELGNGGYGESEGLPGVGGILFGKFHQGFMGLEWFHDDTVGFGEAESSKLEETQIAGRFNLQSLCLQHVVSFHLTKSTGTDLIAELLQREALDYKGSSFHRRSVHEKDSFAPLSFIDFQGIGFRDGIEVLEDLGECGEESDLVRVESQSSIEVLLLVPNG